MKKLGSLLFCCLFLLLTSCSRILDGRHIKRESFVFINTVGIFEACLIIGEESDCKEAKLGSSSSGVLVAKSLKNKASYILTARHSCEPSLDPNVFGQFIEAKKESEITTVLFLQGKEIKAEVLAKDSERDICLLKTEYINYRPVEFSKRKSKPGERIYNLGAPSGVWSPNTIPMFEGFYSGIDLDGDTMYTIPAAPGSSGSPVFNAQGKLIGMISSVIVKFNNLSFGTDSKTIAKFIRKTLKEEGINWNP